MCTVVADNATRDENEGEGGHVLAYVDAVNDVKVSLFSLRSAVGGDGGGESPRRADEMLNPILFSANSRVCSKQFDFFSFCALLIQ